MEIMVQLLPGVKYRFVSGIGRIHKQLKVKD